VGRERTWVEEKMCPHGDGTGLQTFPREKASEGRRWGRGMDVG